MVCNTDRVIQEDGLGVRREVVEADLDLAFVNVDFYSRRKYVSSKRAAF